MASYAVTQQQPAAYLPFEKRTFYAAGMPPAKARPTVGLLWPRTVRRGG